MRVLRLLALAAVGVSPNWRRVTIHQGGRAAGSWLSFRICCPSGSVSGAIQRAEDVDVFNPMREAQFQPQRFEHVTFSQPPRRQAISQIHTSRRWHRVRRRGEPFRETAGPQSAPSAPPEALQCGVRRLPCLHSGRPECRPGVRFPCIATLPSTMMLARLRRGLAIRRGCRRVRRLRRGGRLEEGLVGDQAVRV